MDQTPLYARQLKPLLPAEAFVPARSRLLGLPIHIGIIVVCSIGICGGQAPWPLRLLLSLCIGASFAGLTFLAHEALHGAVVHGQRLRQLVGFIGFLPFVVSPRLWMAWHNRTHHAHTNHTTLDPDAYPTLDAYNQSTSVRIATALAPGGGSWLSLLLPLFLGFTIQSSHVLLCAQRWGYLKAREYRLALFETGLGIALWLCVLWTVGPLAFVFIYVLPLLFANAVVMAFILTNHSLSPLTEVNDPLLNTLTVRLPPFAEWLTLRFGYHVEHHVFPSMSSRHAPLVSAELQKLWPERYQSMQLHKALAALCRTARVYRDAKTLIHPATKRVWPTLTPREGALLAR